MKTLMKGFLGGAILLLAASAAPMSAHAQFYKGKTITFLVGYDTGGANDIRARIIARYLPKYLPGNPNVVVQNMPGASGVKEVNYVYNIAKPDGLTIADINREAALIKINGNDGPQFSFPDFEWIGGISQQATVVFVRSATGYKSVADLQKATKPLIVGSRDVGSINYISGKALELLGVPVKNVFGYSTSDLSLAFERGEIDASSLTLASFADRRNWIEPGGIARLIVSLGTTHEPNVAFGLDYKTVDPKNEELYKFINVSLGLPNATYAAPPKTPAAQTTILRQAFKSMAEDPEFVQDSLKVGVPVKYLTGDEVRSAFVDLDSSPASAKTAFSKLSVQK